MKMDSPQSQSMADDSIKPETNVRTRTELPADFEPGEDDVLMGRGRKCYNHPGNIRFRNMCYDRVPEYIECRGKADKSKIIVDIVRQVRENSPHGGFLKRDSKTGNWYEVRSNLLLLYLLLLYLKNHLYKFESDFHSYTNTVDIIPIFLCYRCTDNETISNQTKPLQTGWRLLGQRENIASIS